MKRRFSNRKKTGFRKGWVILPALAMITFLITEWLSRQPEIAERFYSIGIYPWVARCLSPLSNLFGFSLSDVFYTILVLSIIILLVLTLFRKLKPGRMLLILINMVAVVYLLFYWLWGFNYYRQPFNHRLEINKSVADSAQFMAVFESIIEQANNLQSSSSNNYSVHQIDSLLEQGYQRHSDFLKLRYPMGKRKPKHILFSNFFAKAGISGYYGPFLNEVHINRHIHRLEYPVVVAHEKAHQFGITSEAEASFYAWFICTHSDSDYLRYTASLYLLRYFLNHGRNLEGFNERVKTISQPVRDDLIEIHDHWMALRNEKIDRAASKANDAYLRTNKVEAGIEDYKGVVALVMDFSADTLAQQRAGL